LLGSVERGRGRGGRSHCKFRAGADQNRARQKPPGSVMSKPRIPASPRPLLGGRSTRVLCSCRAWLRHCRCLPAATQRIYCVGRCCWIALSAWGICSCALSHFVRCFGTGSLFNKSPRSWASMGKRGQASAGSQWYLKRSRSAEVAQPAIRRVAGMHRQAPIQTAVQRRQNAQGKRKHGRSQ
jgi:hypothetical protein